MRESEGLLSGGWQTKWLLITIGIEQPMKAGTKVRLRILRIILIASAVLSIGCASQEDDIPIAEIEEALGYVYVPDYIPDSFVFGGVAVNGREGIIPYVSFMYVKTNEASGPTQLFVEYPRHPNQCDMNMYGQAPADAFESRDFNGLPGCIVRGGSKPIIVLGDMDPTAIVATLAATEETEWVYDLGYQIQVHAQVTDTRQTYISISSLNQGKALTEEDLIRIAESLILARN